MTIDNITPFPKERIVRKPDNLNKEKPKGFHQKRVEELLWQLQYEFMKGYDAKEFDVNEEFQFHQTLPLQREDGKFTKFMVVIHPTQFPFNS